MSDKAQEDLAAMLNYSALDVQKALKAASSFNNLIEPNEHDTLS